MMQVVGRVPEPMSIPVAGWVPEWAAEQVQLLVLMLAMSPSEMTMSIFLWLAWV